jgi:hypothetical protein
MNRRQLQKYTAPPRLLLPAGALAIDPTPMAELGNSRALLAEHCRADTWLTCPAGKNVLIKAQGKMEGEACGICGGDGRIANSFGSTATCPGCRGSGRRAEGGGLRDVTKTKPSHHRPAGVRASASSPQGPSTFAGVQLASQVQASSRVSSETKAKLTREIVEHEASHGSCTETFIKKIRKQVKPLD